MTEWKILDALHTVKIGKALWMLTRDMRFMTPEGLILVPKGFVFDHASVPRAFTAIVPPVKSAIAEASVIHDYLYALNSDPVSRKFADKCLKYLTIVNGGSKLLANTAYKAVRVGGFSSFRKKYDYDKLKKGYKGYHMGIEELKETLL